METPNHCAYNQTRECFLALGVADADIQYANLKDLIATLALKSGEGLWVVPFREMPATGKGMLLDLVYLDEECMVIDVEESFLTSRDASSHCQAASVLALPPHTIYSSQTQPGDQLIICMAEEMERRLELLSNSRDHTGVVQSAALLREAPLWSGGPGLLELRDRSKKERPPSHQPYEIRLVEPRKGNFNPPKGWLEKWWSPDPRKAPREPVHSLAAYYWTGASPVAHSIQNISSTGLYLVTEERWYPGTLVLMTLQKTDCGEERGERAIHVYSRAVRWGKDGVGLQFVVSDPQDKVRGKRLLVEAVDRKALNRFLSGLRKGKS